MSYFIKCPQFCFVSYFLITRFTLCFIGKNNRQAMCVLIAFYQFYTGSGYLITVVHFDPFINSHIFVAFSIVEVFLLPFVITNFVERCFGITHCSSNSQFIHLCTAVWLHASSFHSVHNNLF